VARIIRNARMLGRPIVPKGDVANIPMQANSKFRTSDVIIEKPKQELAFVLAQTVYVRGVYHIHVQKFSSGVRVCAHDRGFERGILFRIQAKLKARLSDVPAVHISEGVKSL